MKNVIAIAAGICEGLGFGDNSRAALMTRGLAEITRLGVALGAQTSTFLGLAGVGDLIATGGSRLSRNYRVGIGLGQGKPLEAVLTEIGQVAEGVPTTRAICILARKSGIEMPISNALSKILFESAPARDSIPDLMLRPARDEAEL
jgi:glycerol-3-phosphate dehydrogenase (NAD(P)+)